MKAFVSFFPYFCVFFLPFISSSCPDGSIEFQNDCYFFRPNANNASAAALDCQGVMGYLVSIHDGFLNSFLANQSSNYFNSIDAWIGLKRSSSNNTWSWADETPFDFSEWGPSQPKNTSSGCASLALQNGFWGSAGCSEMKPSICKMSSSTTPTSPSNWNCDDGWLYFEPTHSCYGKNGYDSQSGSWQDGEKYCQNNGGHLISLHSFEEFNFLSGVQGFTEMFSWIGLYSNDNETSWQWSDGTPLDFTPPWASGSPNNKNATSCVALFKNAILDIDCTTTQDFVCKKQAPPLPTAIPPTTPAKGNCSQGWVYFEPTQSCYGHDGDGFFENWNYGETYCKSHGGHLISFHSYDEFQFLSTAVSFTGMDAWTGLKSNENGDSWEWTDGSLVDYLPWAPGYPHWNVTTCAFIEANGILNNYCRISAYIICKKSAF